MPVNLMAIPRRCPKLLSFNQHHQKIKFFWSNPDKINTVRTSCIKTLQSSNFGHLTISNKI